MEPTLFTDKIEGNQKLNQVIDLGGGMFYLETSNALIELINQKKISANNPFYNDYDKNTYSLSDDYFTQQQRYLPVNEVMPWGSRNFLPQNIIKIFSDHAYIPSLLRFKRRMVLGKGLKTYRKIIVGQGEAAKEFDEPTIDKEINDWLRFVNVDKYLRETSLDSVWMRNVFVQIIKSKDGKNVVNLNRIDASNCRIDTKVQTCFAYETWDDIISHINFVRTALYNPDIQQFNFIYHAKDVYPGSTIYGVNTANSGNKWVEFANEIPIYKLSAIRNGFTIKYHIKIPIDYFVKNYPDGMLDVNGKPIENINAYRKTKEIELYDNLNKYLSGGKNANKAVISKYWIDPATQKPIEGFQIDTLDDKFKYDAFLEDLDASDTRILSAFNMFPSVAGIKTVNKLGGGGSETRNDYNIASQIMPIDDQDLVLEALELAKNIQFPNKTDIRFGFRTVELTTTDLVKSGFVENK